MTDQPQPWDPQAQPQQPQQPQHPQQPPAQPTHAELYPQPEYGQPQPGQAQHAQPEHAQPTYGQPTYGQPQYGQAQYGPAQHGQAQYAQPAFGQPQYGQAPYGQPQYAQAPYASGYAQPGYPMQPPPKKPALLPAALPMSGLAYTQVLQPLERRVGRWFLAWAIAIGFFFAGQLISLALLMPGMVDFFLRLDPTAVPTDETEFAADMIAETIGSPLGMAGVNLAWASMIPGTIVAIAAFGKRAAGFASSVVGRWRWGTAGRAAIVILPIFALYIGLSLWLDPSIEWQWNPNWGLVAVVLLTTPLQATGEEFTFRGLLPQMMGGWLRHRYVPALVMLLPVAAVMLLQPATWWLSLLALAAAAIGPWVLRGRFGNAVWTGLATGLLFGAMHAHPSISATLQLSLVGFTCSMLTYRTGGLEAASVLHTANNVFIMVPLALTGTSAFGAQPVAGEDWLSFGITLLALALAYLAVHFTMRREQQLTEGSPAADLLAPPAPSVQQPQPVGAPAAP
ncbi:CPBP family intramembrane glutamic endopeptidase [Agrococcus carbonis]|uniref:CAAX protease self-immunity n=1 Tax=Agrococcus carbonis TaxID=684552 RepID=A0A1H1QED7_9MICO|nr:CPBP family intramembrane glutamic endopeptidase [Agrococcus carbonis]SDS21785.1 CAAX protease self-immunity [Agrococcus carbonis]